MRTHTRRQLILDLTLEPRHRTIGDPPEELLQALADLLLEAFGEEASEEASPMEILNESEDHG